MSVLPRRLPTCSRALFAIARPLPPRAWVSSSRAILTSRGYATVSDHDAEPQEANEEVFDPLSVERATDEVDVCIVGGGPAGLSAAIRLKQLEQEKGNEIRVVVLEKGAEVGE